MDNKHLKLNANLIVAALQKPASELTKADIIDYIVNNDIRMVNFMYPGGDGKLKTLNFVINDLDYLETILTCGERVDGSSLFSFIQAGSSDLYVLPRMSQLKLIFLQSTLQMHPYYQLRNQLLQIQLHQLISNILKT